MPRPRTRPEPPAFDFYTDCVNCPGADAGDAINAMKAQAMSVTYATMRRHCPGLLKRARELGYSRDIPLHGDWHVSYHRSIFRGRRCYYFCWSAIEQIFLPRERVSSRNT